MGASKRLLTSEECSGLSLKRARRTYLPFDRQVVPETGIDTLSEQLLEPLLNVAGATDPIHWLINLGLLAHDDSEVVRATIAGVLLCATSPEDWLPQAAIIATHYSGTNRASRQLDSQEIVGPLQRQVEEAVNFVVRNMRVAALKTPERESIPQYSKIAVFEAVVNAVAHRDYSMSSRKIKISMFEDRLEIETPGSLPKGMTPDGMDSIRVARNEVIASVLGRVAVRDIAGSDYRKFLMEQRGVGVANICKETLEATGLAPKFELINGTSLNLRIPSAKLQLVPADAKVTVRSQGELLTDVDVLVLFPNKTWIRETTNELGEAQIDLYTTNLPMTVYAAKPGFRAGLIHDWVPNDGGLLLELEPLASGGSVIFTQSTGKLPGMSGTLNPILDAYDRTYLYADNIAVSEGKQQPVSFRIGKPLRLTDSRGVNLSVTVVAITSRSSLIEYRPFVQ